MGSEMCIRDRRIVARCVQEATPRRWPIYCRIFLASAAALSLPRSSRVGGRAVASSFPPPPPFGFVRRLLSHGMERFSLGCHFDMRASRSPSAFVSSLFFSVLSGRSFDSPRVR